MAEGMLGITPEVEEAGRGGDTEVGYIEQGSVVIPIELVNDEDFKEIISSVKELITLHKQDPKKFKITEDSELYAYNKDNTIPAHLTVGEFVIPVQALNVVTDLEGGLRQLFSDADMSFDEFLVGSPSNKINPETGYPEFFGFVKKVWKKAKSAVKNTVKAVKKGIDSVVDFGKNFVKALGQGAEDFFSGDWDAVLKNPAVIATASFMFPAYGAYISLGAKALTGQEITATDLVAAGFSASTDFAGVTVDPNVTKAVTTAATIADGGDPLEALVANYGSDFAKDLELDVRVKNTLADTLGDDYATRITSNFDINKAAADYAAGNSTERILANQYGDEIVGYLGAETPTEQALGYAGIETLLQKSEGASDNDALLAGAETYYKQGGQLPDLQYVADLTGIEDFDIDLNNVIGDLGIDFPDLKLQGYDLPQLADLGVNLGNLNIQAPDFFESNLTLGEFADLGVDFGKLDFSGYKPTDLGDYSIAELQGLGVDLPSLDLNMELQMIGLADLLGGDYGGLDGAPLQPGEELAMLEPNLDFLGDEDTPFSRQLLESGKIA